MPKRPKYPTDFLNKIMCGDCVKLVPKLPDAVIDGVFVDPPYGEKMGFKGDASVTKAVKLLSAFLSAALPKIKLHGLVAIFWTLKDLDLCIDTVREAGLTYRRMIPMYVPQGSARPWLGWLPRTQAVVICERHLPLCKKDLHRRLAEHLKAAMEESGYTNVVLARKVGCSRMLVMKWIRHDDPVHCLPTPRFYRKLKSILHLSKEFDSLLTRKVVFPPPKRRDFEYQHDTYVVKGKAPEKLHPTQKPLPVVSHIVSCIAPRGGVVLDGFAGVGTTALAARATGRKFVCIELDRQYCAVARKRLRAELPGFKRRNGPQPRA